MHKNIRIAFQERRYPYATYEAVEFLEADESSVNGDTMLARTDSEDGGAIRYHLISVGNHEDEFPRELRPYALATKIPVSGNPRFVYLFRWSWYEHAWREREKSLDDQWGDETLVLRYCGHV